MAATQVSLGRLRRELLDTTREAREAGEGLGAAVSAYKVVAVLHGLYTQKKQVEHRSGRLNIYLDDGKRTGARYPGFPGRMGH